MSSATSDVTTFKQLLPLITSAVSRLKRKIGKQFHFHLPPTNLYEMQPHPLHTKTFDTFSSGSPVRLGYGDMTVSKNADREPAARFTEAWHAHCLRQPRRQRCTHRDARAGTAVRLEGGGGDASPPSDYLWGMEVRS